MTAVLIKTCWKQRTVLLVFVLTGLGFPMPTFGQPQPLDMDDVYAWCIIPYDRMERTPGQRIAMLQDLGFTSYAYDWRQQHLPQMADELRQAQEAGLKIPAVWVWIDRQWESSARMI